MMTLQNGYAIMSNTDVSLFGFSYNWVVTTLCSAITFAKTAKVLTFHPPRASLITKFGLICLCVGSFGIAILPLYGRYLGDTQMLTSIGIMVLVLQFTDRCSIKKAKQRLRELVPFTLHNHNSRTGKGV